MRTSWILKYGSEKNWFSHYESSRQEHGIPETLLNEIEENIEERSHAISDAHEKVIEINAIVKGLEYMVNDQGTILGRLK